jgi:hypothetical protein
MDNDQMHDRDPEDNELARRLEAYADARLSPELSATTRMRAHVMAAAHRQAALAQADRDRAAAEAAGAVARADRTRRTPWRRAATLLLAAGLTLAVGVGSVAAAQAGGPLYSLRVWSETLTLPAEADARAQAELKRLTDRLAEAAAATGAGDTNAANAALEAYAGIVKEATENAGSDVSAAATLDAGVRNNIDVLTVLVDRMAERGNENASEAIQRALERAIERSDSALDKMHGKPDDTPGNGPPADPGNRPAATDKEEKPPNSNKPAGDPVDKTPKPHPTPNAGGGNPNTVSTPEAEHTPRAGPPSSPSGGGNPGGGSPGGDNPGGGNPRGGNDNGGGQGD